MSWKKIVISSDKSIQFAIKKIDVSDIKIILVINKNKKLVGTVTDGDIRRFFLKNDGNLNSAIKYIMTKKPIVAYQDDSDEYILEKMKALKINYIPQINKDGSIVGLKSLDSLIKRDSYENPVLLMAGGFGKRMMPLTKDTPKPLLKINDIPILEIIINKFIKYGFKNFFVSTHYKSNLIKKYFGNGKKWNINIKYLEEKKPLGTAGSLQLIPKSDIKLPVLVMNGDVLTNINFKKLLKSHIKKNVAATICVREESVKSEFGVVRIKNSYLDKIDEKPVNKFLINAGIYVININKISKITKNTYIDMTTLLNNMVAKKNKINIYYLYEEWQDIGHINEYKKAIQSLNKIK